MNDTRAKQLRILVQKVIDLLVAKDYRQLVQLAGSVRFSEKDIGDLEDVITGYGRTLVKPPENAFRDMNVIEVKGATPRRWAVDMPLWTAEEGKSDLEVRLTLIEHQNDFIVELDDVLVP